MGKLPNSVFVSIGIFGRMKNKKISKQYFLFSRETISNVEKIIINLQSLNLSNNIIIDSNKEYNSIFIRKDIHSHDLDHYIILNNKVYRKIDFNAENNKDLVFYSENRILFEDNFDPNNDLNSSCFFKEKKYLTDLKTEEFFHEKMIEIKVKESIKKYKIINDALYIESCPPFIDFFCFIEKKIMINSSIAKINSFNTKHIHNYKQYKNNLNFFLCLPFDCFNDIYSQYTIHMNKNYNFLKEKINKIEKAIDLLCFSTPNLIDEKYLDENLYKNFVDFSVSYFKKDRKKINKHYYQNKIINLYSHKSEIWNNFNNERYYFYDSRMIHCFLKTPKIIKNLSDYFRYLVDYNHIPYFSEEKMSLEYYVKSMESLLNQSAIMNIEFYLAKNKKNIK